MGENVDDMLEELGALALASRFKRLADGLMQDGVKIYQSLGVGFEPRWFPVFIYLYRRGPTSITGLAKGLGVSHPGINKIANELIEARLVAPYKDRNDKRKRVLALTSLGRDKQSELEPVWRRIRQTLQSAVDESGGNFLDLLAATEQSFARSGFHDRYFDDSNNQIDDITIKPYAAEYCLDFQSLNRSWINHYFELEAADEKSLSDPETSIIKPGGEILFAIDSVSSEVLGTCALVKENAESFELAKMAVSERAKGRQIGRQLGEAILDVAKLQGGRRVFLESNTKLTPAISLYRKLGFIEKPFPTPSEYSRANIYMELVF